MFLLAFTLGLHTGTWGFVFVCTVLGLSPLAGGAAGALAGAAGAGGGACAGAGV